ncbi:tryptophan 7-halogenase [Sphingomonas sanguinis]|uniref:tryptophan halogenase family protein n=1 Tax=Sphingomonas sp. LC-1 TaxID=3110957 RepID=UPI0021BB047D|nr:tryptophan halogenase family protein [Sphingomonas sp. LC-1]MCT8000969.1 tryptophan 7-halogenase [Sphingomonas sp. LC-1]
MRQSPDSGPDLGQDAAIRRIVILGGGTAGWMAAAAFSRVLGANGPAITLIESEEIGSVGVGEATIPPIQAFNALLGIDEREFVAATHGSFKLGIEFVDWRRTGHRYFHPFGTYGHDFGLIPFEAIWQRMAQTGRAEPLDSYALATLGARANRFTTPRPGNTPLGHIGYAYHFDAGLYARFLRGRAEAQGVTRREGRVGHVERRADGLIDAIVMQDGTRMAGDLFIDCSGFRSLLLGETLGVGFEDWEHWLPNDRAIAVPCARSGALTPYTRSTAHGAGWQWRIPLQHRTGNGIVYASRYLSEDEATAGLLAGLDGAAMGEPRALRFRAGRRDRLWQGNCVALGLAGGFLEPLESTSIHLIQVGIARLLEMLPTMRFEAADQRRYNRLMVEEMADIRDFLILHFHLTERDDTPYWRYLRHMDVPESLQDRLAIYRATGRIHREGEALFTKTSWLAVMDGQGLKAQGFDPLALGMAEDEAAARLAHIAQVTRKSVALMPDHDAFLRQHGYGMINSA